MNGLLNPELVSDLQFALDVMEERSHLGMDDEGADQLKDILIRQIEEAKHELGHRPTDRNEARGTRICSAESEARNGVLE